MCNFAFSMKYQELKVPVHSCDVLWRKNLAKTHSQASLNTSCIVNLFNPIELWSIAMPSDGQKTNSNVCMDVSRPYKF